MDRHLIPLETPCVYYIPDIFTSAESKSFYETLHKTVAWEKTPKINRWVSLFEEEAANGYRYRDAPKAAKADEPTTSQAISSCPVIDTIRRRCEEVYETNTGRKVEFNTCLANFYETGEQRIGWHADREEIGRTTPIASVSLGATRKFLLRHKLNGCDKASIDMDSGSVVYMENVCQQQYLHSVPKQSEVVEGRINLTFRCKTSITEGEEAHNRRDNFLESVTNDVGTGGANGGELGTEDIEEMLAAEMAGHKTVVFGDGTPIGAPEDLYGNVSYTISCNIGTECPCAAEVREMLGDDGWKVVARPWGIAGYVACIAEDDVDAVATASKLLEMRSALNIMQYHDHFDLEDVRKGKEDPLPITKIDGEMLYAFYKKRLEANRELIPPLASATKEKIVSFRVTTDRIGDHAFKAPTVEYEMGGAISEFYEHSKPKMTDYDVNIRIDVVADQIIIGTQINVEDLSRRHFLRFRNSVTIKTNLAYVMLRLANIRDNGLLVDPFCGSGTILLEALEMSNKRIKCIGLDVSRRSAKGASENALAEGYGPDQCEFHCADARALRKHVGEDRMADAIVSNPPWGVRTGHKQSVYDLQQMYETFLRCCWYILKDGGRIVLLVLRGLQLMRIVRKLSGRYRIVKIQVVRTTNNLPTILVIEKVGRDILRESVKTQLAYMSRFVSVSKEMYDAINNETIDW